MTITVKVKPLLGPMFQENRSDELADHTHAYWGLSLAARGRSKVPMTIGDAITATQAVMRNTGPHRVLHRYILELSTQLVLGNKGKRKTKPSSTPPAVLFPASSQ